MTECNLMLDSLMFTDGLSHMDVLNKKCRELFAADPDMLLIRVYRNDQHFNNGNKLGRIYRPGHTGYYQDCGEVIWKYLRTGDDYVIEGDKAMVCDESV